MPYLPPWFVCHHRTVEKEHHRMCVVQATNSAYQPDLIHNGKQEDSVPEEDWENLTLSPEPLLLLLTQLQSSKYSYAGAAQSTVVTSASYITPKEVASHPDGTGNLFFNIPTL